MPTPVERKVILDRGGDPLLEMVKIPAGEFLMGSANSDFGASGNEKPQKRIHLNEYWIARTPVTNRMWKKFLQESGYNPLKEDHDGDYLKHWGGRTAPNDKLEHPVVYISYINAWAFCDFYGLMLPCEAQWEKAVRGSDGRIYPWGNQEPTTVHDGRIYPWGYRAPTGDLCNFNGAKVDGTTPVGRYPKGMSVYGLLDCSGNVWEWCADAWDESWLQKISNENIVSNNHANLYSLRGGSFDRSAHCVRCAARNYAEAALHYGSIGFRPVLEAEPE